MQRARKRGRERSKSDKKPRKDTAEDVPDENIAFEAADDAQAAGAEETGAVDSSDDNETAADKRLRLGASPASPGLDSLAACTASVLLCAPRIISCRAPD